MDSRVASRLCRVAGCTPRR